MMRELFYLLTIIAIWVCPLQGMSDTIPVTEGRIFFLRAGYSYSQILKQNQAFLTSVNALGQSFEGIDDFGVEAGWQLWSGLPWYEICNRPRMGIGINYMKVQNRNDLGHPLLLYGFLDGIQYRRGRLALTTRYTLGVGYIGTINKTGDLPRNDILSTHLNIFAEIGAGLEIRATDDLYIDPGVHISHLSNGNIIEPQKGLNVLSWSLGLRKSFKPLIESRQEPVFWPQQNRHELVGFLSFCPRQIEFYDQKTKEFIGTYDMTFLMGNLHLGYNYEWTRRIKLSTGFDIIYDGTNGQQQLALTGLPDRYGIPLGDKMRIAVFVGWESVLNNLSFIGNFGYVIVQKKYFGTTPAFQQRLGFKYHFYKNMFAGINVRTHQFRIAEALEFNVGMRKYIGSHE